MASECTAFNAVHYAPKQSMGLAVLQRSSRVLSIGAFGIIQSTQAVLSIVQSNRQPWLTPLFLTGVFRAAEDFFLQGQR